MVRCLFLCLAFFLVFGCSNTEQAGQAQIMPSIHASPISETKPTQIPLTETIAHSPISPVATPIKIPQPRAGKGAISGQLTWFFEEEFRIGREIPLQIGKVLYDTEGVPRFHSVSQEHDPVAWTDQFGRFAFLDVEPATYGIYLLVPGFNSFLLTEHGAPLAMMIEVKANEITELGDIILDFPF